MENVEWSEILKWVPRKPEAHEQECQAPRCAAAQPPRTADGGPPPDTP